MSRVYDMGVCTHGAHWTKALSMRLADPNMYVKARTILARKTTAILRTLFCVVEDSLSTGS